MMTAAACWQKRQRNEQPAAAYLADDLVIEILVRLPAMPLGRCKCVSRSWRDLISGPVHRRRLAHADAASGFFYHAHAGAGASWAPSTTNLSFAALCPPEEGEGGSPSPPPPAPSLDQAFPFLPCPSTTGTEVKLLDSCNGLLLLRCRRHAHNNYDLAALRYIVCNPAADGWAVELPVPSPEEPCRARAPDPSLDQQRRWECPGWLQLERDRDRTRLRLAALAFDPAVSSHFHVLELIEEDDDKRHRSPCRAVKAVRIYSSETGKWARRDSAWSRRVAYAGENACLFSGSEWSYRLTYAGSHAYLDGSLHLATTDVENGDVVVASVDTLGKTWRATRVGPPAELLSPAAPGVFGQSQHRLLYADAGGSVYALVDCAGGERRWVLKHRTKSLEHHSVVGIHPDCNVIFLFDRWRRSLIAYDMDRGTTRVVHTFTDATTRMCRFFPYVPLYLQ
ncbi:unnamed protein product [Urochloa humidicola]